MKLVKEICPPGTYNVNRLNGETGEETFTPERMKRWVDTFRRMKDAGLRVPMPFKHDPNAVATDKPLDDDDSRNNGGWWEDLFIDSAGKLHGIVDIPDDHPNASSLGTTIQEVSPLVLSKWKDGAGREWEDAMVHIAAVTHPVVPGQANFEKLPDDAPLASAMSFQLSSMLPKKQPAANGPTGSLTTVIEALKGLGIDLPADTTAQNLAERLVVACNAITGYKTQGHEGPNGNPEEQPLPIVMSQTIQEPETVSTPAQQPAQDQAATVSALSALIADDRKASYTRRVEALVTSGRVTPAQRDQQLKPLIEGFQLSLDPQTHKPLDTELDRLLAILEATPEPKTKLNGAPLSVRAAAAKNGFQGSQNLQEHDLPAGLDAPVGSGLAPIENEEEFEKSVQQQIRQAGFRA